MGCLLLIRRSDDPSVAAATATDALKMLRAGDVVDVIDDDEYGGTFGTARRLYQTHYVLKLPDVSKARVLALIQPERVSVPHIYPTPRVDGDGRAVLDGNGDPIIDDVEGSREVIVKIRPKTLDLTATRAAMTEAEKVRFDAEDADAVEIAEATIVTASRSR